MYMSRWTSFLRQNGGKGYTRSELSALYQNQKGGGWNGCPVCIEIDDGYDGGARCCPSCDLCHSHCKVHCDVTGCCALRMQHKMYCLEHATEIKALMNLSDLPPSAAHMNAFSEVSKKSIGELTQRLG